MDVRRDTYDFHGIRIRVESDSAAISTRLSSRLRRFASEYAEQPHLTFQYSATRGDDLASPAHVGSRRQVYDSPIGDVTYADDTDRFHISIPGRLELVSDGRTGTTRTILHSSTEGDSWLASHPFFTLAFLEQLKRHNLFGIHAALLAHEGRSIVIAGGSGAGKSTITLCLLRAGFSFGGDDLCFIRPRNGLLRVHAFPDEVDVAETTAAFFPELAGLLEKPARPDTRKWPLLPENIYPVAFASECEPAVLVFPRIGDSRESRLEEMDSAEALFELVPNVMLTDPRTAQSHLDAIGMLVRQSRSYRLSTGRDFDRLPRLLESTLNPHLAL